MKVIILAGGMGTRISEYTDAIPKPMIKIGDKPILWHIMKHYASFNHKDFYIALGYKAEIIKEYFLNLNSLHSDFSINLSNGKLNQLEKSNLDWKITSIDTGLKTMTGGRVKRLQPFIKETFLLTYGDALANININKLVEFHKSHGKMVTVSAVHPMARFGELNLLENQVKSFNEKPQTKKDWINGGFFVCEPSLFDYIEDDNTILERSPLEEIARAGELMAYKHDDFWKCMDTKRDHESFQDLWESNLKPWVVDDPTK